MDSLTAHYLAAELDARWRGRRIVRSAIDRRAGAIRVQVAGEPHGVCFDFRGAPARVHACSPPIEAGPLGGWLVDTVSAPVDERRLLVELARPGKFRGSSTRRAVVEMSFVPAARGGALRSAGDDAGRTARVIARVGSALPPVHAPRPVLTDDELARAAAAHDGALLVAGRWMSPWLAAWLLEHPERIVDEYRRICALPSARPAWCGDRLVPFPLCEDAVPASSLVMPEAPLPARDASRQAPAVPTRDARETTGVPTMAAATAVSDAALRSANARARAAERAVQRMRRELERAREAPRVRATADALIALGAMPAPAELQLPDGSRVPLDPLPGETAAQCADRLYKRARAMERATEQLPARIAAAERAAAASEPAPSARRLVPQPRARGRALQGGARVRGRRSRQVRASVPGAGGHATAGAAPFRTYRSSDGLAIWVGRGAASNDQLTFHDSAPNDIWLHARGAAGAHVILRWQGEGAPPERDLHQAALLAAWHSKARHATVVPVDWTRRKHVRKPRGAPPGLVTITHARTLFVRPSARVERELREPR